MATVLGSLGLVEASVHYVLVQKHDGNDILSNRYCVEPIRIGAECASLQVCSVSVVIFHKSPTNALDPKRS